MDARALSAAAKVEVGTLNAWIQRGQVPGVAADAQGRRRDFDLITATHLAIMAELVRFGFGAPWAAIAARYALRAFQDHYPYCVVAHPIEEGSVSEGNYRARFGMVSAKSEAKIRTELAALPPDKRPNVYVVIDTLRLIKKMLQAEKEWQQSRKRPTRRKANA